MNSSTPMVIPGQPICKRPHPATGLAPTALSGAPAPSAAPVSVLAKPEAAPPGKRPGQPASPSRGDAEISYLRKHSKAKTPVVVVLKSGAVLQGRIAWTDACAVKIDRKPDAPNVLIYKTAIAYIHKAETARDDNHE